MLLMDGEPIPARSSLEAHQTNEDYRNGVWAIVAVDISRLSSKTRRINITLPERVLAIVDQAAVRERQSRSGLLVRAALSYVQRQSEGTLQGVLTDGPEPNRSYPAGPQGQTRHRAGDGE